MPRREALFLRRMVGMMLAGCSALLLGMFLHTPDNKE